MQNTMPDMRHHKSCIVTQIGVENKLSADLCVGLVRNDGVYGERQNASPATENAPYGVYGAFDIYLFFSWNSVLSR